MKKKTLPVLALVVLVLSASCTFQSVVSPTAGNKGRVIIGASHTKERDAANGRLALPQNRALSAKDDIVKMSYSVINTGDSPEPDRIGTFEDPRYPYLELMLIPGESYRLIVSVETKATAPGSKVGVTGYGDVAEFTVETDYDTYVDLSVRPNKMTVFDPASIDSTGKVTAWNPVTNQSSLVTFSPSDITTYGPSDRFFYGPDARLFYFNKDVNKIYEWRDTSVKLSNTDIVIDGSTLLDDAATDLDMQLNLFVACADPTTPATLWIGGESVNSSVKTWNFYKVDISNPNEPVVDASSTSGDLSLGVPSGATLVPTGIAVDTTYGDVYITYYFVESTGVITSGIHQYWNGELQDYDYDIYQNRTFTDANSSIYTDVMWDQGKLFVLASPNTTLGTPANTGRSDLLAFDDFMNLLGTFPNPATGARLFQPNRFAGFIQGSDLYVSQRDIKNPDVSNWTLTKINLWTDAVTHVATKP